MSDKPALTDLMTTRHPTMRDADMPILDRIKAAIDRIANGHAHMRVPVEATDPDIVLSDCRVTIAALATQAEAHAAELRIAHDAIEVAYDACQNLPDDDDGDAAVKRCTLRRLNEAVGKALPRLLMERPEGQRLFGLRWKELAAELSEDREQLSAHDAIRAQLEAERDARDAALLEIREWFDALSDDDIGRVHVDLLRKRIDAARTGSKP